MLLIIFLSVFYCVGVGAAFTVIGEKCHPHDYWESPGPFFGSLVWPIFIPALVGSHVGHAVINRGSRESRTEKRHARELDEANHRKEIARINAEAIELQEREAGMR